MKALTREEAVTSGKKFKLPEIVLEIIGDKVPESIKLYFSSPIVYKLTDREQEAYGFGKILPLWSTGNGDVVYAYDMVNQDYFRFNWSGDIDARYSSWNDLIGENISRVIDIIWDDQSEDEILSIVKEIFEGFNVEDINTLFQEVLKDG